MTADWATKALSKKVDPDQYSDTEIVVYVEGSNVFGDKIYSYLQTTIGNLKAMRLKAEAGDKFLPSDFGTVIAAGKGNPSEELKAEMQRDHEMVYMPPIRPKNKTVNFTPRVWGGGEDEQADNPPA